MYELQARCIVSHVHVCNTNCSLGLNCERVGQERDTTASRFVIGGEGAHFREERRTNIQWVAASSRK